MKIRQGFVSNSSSAGFILHHSEVTPEQWRDILAMAEAFVAQWGCFYDSTDRYMYIDASDGILAEFADKFNKIMKDDNAINTVGMQIYG